MKFAKRAFCYFSVALSATMLLAAPGANAQTALDDVMKATAQRHARENHAILAARHTVYQRPVHSTRPAGPGPPATARPSGL